MKMVLNKLATDGADVADKTQKQISENRGKRKNLDSLATD
jgi:hypothetical protein